MLKKLWIGLAGICCAGAFANPVSPATLTRLAPMPKAPVIDGKIMPSEWDAGTVFFGGINPQNNLMTFRRNNFRIGYDAGNIYLSISSEMPMAPLTLTDADQVEFQLQAPGTKEPLVIRIDSNGRGVVPAGVKIANGFAADLVTSNQGKCWIVEVQVPLSTIHMTGIQSGAIWGIQMMRHWANQQETGCLHVGKVINEMASFIPDPTAPAISFDGFGHHSYIATGNYKWSVRMENSTGRELRLKPQCYTLGIEGAPTLDIENPDLTGNAVKTSFGTTKIVKPGKTEFIELFKMAQFPGQPRLIYTQITDAQNGKEYFRRSLFWELSKARRTGVFLNTAGLPYLCAGFYPSYGNKLRVAGVFSTERPCVAASVTLKDSAGKTLWSLNKGNFGYPIRDFEEETVLKNLPLGDYRVIMESIGTDGKKYTHERTFSIRKFPWQNLNIGMERVIVPPFKPLKVDEKKAEIHALLTGYRINGELWDQVYAEGENILEGPIQFILNGKPFGNGKTKLVSKECDQVVYETEATSGKVRLELKQVYDYDGFCKVSVKVIPTGKVSVNDFSLRIPLRNEIVQYYNCLHRSGVRAKGAPSMAVPSGEGILNLTGIRKTPGRIIHYFWFGGQYKGFCWMMENDRYFSLNPKTDAQRLERKKNAVIYTQDIVNIPTVWEKPFELTMGFEPTPVKPQTEEYRRIGEYMYDYEPPKGADFAGLSTANIVSDIYYPLNIIPNEDKSCFEHIFEHRNKRTTREVTRKYADDYLARNGEWIRKNMPLADLDWVHQFVRDIRKYGMKYFLLYRNPALYSHVWPEAEMYKAEWLPWDYPVDDAANEYIATHTREYIDKMLWEMRSQARMGYDGMNFDCFPLGGGFNTMIEGSGYRTRPGKVPFIHNGNMLQIAPSGINSGVNLFTWRELTKRTATMLYMEKKLVYGIPWVELHATDSQCVPVTAFCATTITWERGSGGGEYQTRFPESYNLADIVGTQSGIIPRTIVSTNGAVKNVSVQDETKTLIAVSFGYALMNHSDQGVRRNNKAYQTARDAVFSFGYGRPENRTLPFYGKAKQPVTCSAKDIRMTQVIRPDGKTLLMIGNMGNTVEADFDLSGLGYGDDVMIRDVFTGKVLSSAKIRIEQHGYALLLIEKQGENMKLLKNSIFTLAVAATTVLPAQEIKLDQAADWKHETSRPVKYADGIFTLDGVVHLFSQRMFNVEPGKKYAFTAEFRNPEAKKLPGICTAVVFVDENGRKIPAREYMTIPSSETELVAPVALTDNVLTVKKNPIWKTNKQLSLVVAFDVKSDQADLPNSKISTVIKSFENVGDTVKVTLTKPLYASFPAGTKVRLHRSAAFYQPCPENMFYHWAGTEWKQCGGSFTVPAKVKKFFPAIIYYDWGKSPVGSFEMRNAKIIVK